MCFGLNTLHEGGEGALMDGNQRDQGFIGLTIQSDDASVMDHSNKTRMVGII